LTAILEMHITGSSLSQDCDLSSALVFSPSSGRSANLYCSIYFWFNQVTDGEQTHDTASVGTVTDICNRTLSYNLQLQKNGKDTVQKIEE
jgi:hypothetical protein